MDGGWVSCRAGNEGEGTNGIAQRLLQICLLVRLVALLQETVGVLGEELRTLVRRGTRLVAIDKLTTRLEWDKRVSRRAQIEVDDTDLIERCDESLVTTEGLGNELSVLLVHGEEGVDVCFWLL